MESRVRHWVRNVERDERFSFWLPTATGYFYPDFVAELVDGRGLFLMATAPDDDPHRRDVARQIGDKIDGR
ncbi:MAG: hypothetical protein KAX42_04055 [Sphaerotilus sp.]|jgi:hypothetical protein|nr:hypothetical protein [Sphaerotilus sp.]